jgi:hypothetical protein
VRTLDVGPFVHEPSLGPNGRLALTRVRPVKN